MNLLPLGSIVVLKNGYKKLMIIGRKQIQQSENKIWDYLGVLYPEGYVGLGYLDLEEDAFKLALKNLNK